MLPESILGIARDSKNVDPLRFMLGSSDRSLPHNSISKQKIDKVILNYFIQEGFQDAAITLSKESGIHLKGGNGKWTSQSSSARHILTQNHSNVDDFVKAVKRYSEASDAGLSWTGNELTAAQDGTNERIKGYSSMEKRRRIKYLILKGEITAAIRSISTYFPTVLDSNNLLLFKLLRLNLIEMIRNHKFRSEKLECDDGAAERKFLEEILHFVRENLVSKVIHSFELLRELEMTMSLLCFNFDPSRPIDEMVELPDELKQLFDLSLRSECYRVVNSVILDLETSDISTQQYKGLSFAEFSPSMLQKLPHAEPIETTDDVEMAESDAFQGVEPVKGLESMISFAPASPTQTELVPFDSSEKTKKSSVEQATLDSQLEKIAKMWLVTEQRLVDKKIIPKKRYYRHSTDRVML